MQSYYYTCGVSKTMRHNNSITLSYSFNVMFQPTDYLAILHSYRNWMLQVFSVDQECELCIIIHHAGRPFLPPHYIEMDGLGVILHDRELSSELS